jgi:glycosyltransferase involved in cell wall biosynthesis
VEPLRILILVASFAIEGPLGGVARFVVELGRALDRKQVTPILAALWDYHTEGEARWLDRLRDEGFEAFIGAGWDEEAPYHSCVAALRGLWQQAPRPVDIIHSHGEFTDLAALALRRHLRARVVVRTVHNEFEWAKRPAFGRFFPNVLYPFAFDAELGVAQQVVENLDRRPLARLLQRRGRRVYNALNLERFRNIQVDRVRKRHSLGLPAGAKVVGTVGRLAPQKGYPVLLDAVPHVLQAAPDTVFLIIGTGPLAEPLQAQAQALGIGDRVIFTGARTDVDELYSVMNCFVSSSLWEGLPTVVMESMAAGVPVVATAVGGSVELVKEGETGLLAPPNDSVALAHAILRLLNEPELADSLARRAATLVRERFSITAVARQQAELYHSLLSG